MAPIEQDLKYATLQAIAGLGGYALTAVVLTTLLFYNVLYKSYKALPPSQDTRHRQSSREKHVRIHAGLAVAAISAACYQLFQYSSLSYRVWAHETGHQVPALRTSGWDLSDHHHIGSWFLDTHFLQDALEIITDRSRRYWWAQQHLLATASFALFAGLESKRRQIRHLWAFLLLAQFVSLSFAINLFFVALLLSPISKASASVDQSAKDSQHSKIQLPLVSDTINELLTRFRRYLPPLPIHPHALPWTPSPYAFIPTILVLQATIYLLPYTTATPHFLTALAIINIASYRLAYMDRLTPVAFGSTASPTRKYPTVYRAASLVSLLLHIKSTTVALLDNDPGAYPSTHPHSAYLAALRLPHEQSRSNLTRSRLSFTRVLASLNDHPVVAMVGFDVLLAALSLCTWAVLRGLSVQQIMYAAGVVHVKPLSAREAADIDAIKQTTTSAAAGAKPRRRKKRSTLPDEASEVETPTPTPAAKENAGDDVAARGDRTFQPPAPVSRTSRGEEEEDENLEAGAVGGALAVIGGLGVLVNGILGAESES